MAEQDSLGPAEHAEIQQAIGRALVEAAPSGWNELRYEFRATIQIDGDRFESVASDGMAARISAPFSVMELFAELRSAMYRPGVGTWFTARYVVNRLGDYKFDFDYDSEPDFNPQLTPGAFALDLEYFPRDDEHMPEWLREMVRQAGS